MAWLNTSSLTLDVNSRQATILDGTGINGVAPHDALMLEGTGEVLEIRRTYLDTENRGVLELEQPYGGIGKYQGKARCMPISGEFQAAAKALREAIDQIGYDRWVEDWYTTTEDSITVKKADGSSITIQSYHFFTTTFDTEKNTRLQQLDDLHDSKEAALNELIATNNLHMRTEADMQAMRAMNNEQFAASGMVHAGKHLSNETETRHFINQGMWTNEAVPNILNLGRIANNTGGDSKTDYPVVNIAGFVSKLESNKGVPGTSFPLYFPEAEKGTRVYDSTTGQSIDYSKDPDPKYDNTVADTLTEAVCRAWEGIVRNGDFRKGDDGAWVSSSTADGQVTIDTTGIKIVAGAEATSDFISNNTFATKKGVRYKVEFDIAEIGNAVSVRIRAPSGYQFTKIYTTSGSHSFEFEGTEDYTGADFVIVVSHGRSCKLSRLAIAPTTREVVTRRVDLAGLEAFLRPINPGDHVYTNGCIQSLASEMNGIATADDPKRPDSFFAMYQGQEGLRGLGVDFFAKSVLEQDYLASDPDNNIYRMADGTICQWSIRARTFAGLGNGDWLNVQPTIMDLKFDNASFLKPQGNKDSIESCFGKHDAGTTGYFAKSTNSKFSGGSGVFGAINPANTGRDTNIAYSGECYLYVISTIPRLNQSCYHLTLSPYGTASFHNLGVYNRTWDQLEGDEGITTPADCFKHKALGLAGDGSISRSQGYNGRPDKIAYDAIRASGISGVIDHRLPAWDMPSSAKIAETWEAVKSGEFRGAEKLKITQISQNPALNTETTASFWFLDSEFIGLVDNGNLTKVHIVDGDIVVASLQPHELFYPTVKLDGATGEVYIRTKDSYARTPNTHIVFEIDSDITVSGEYLQIDVIGLPENILKMPELMNGGYWRWIPTVPDGTSKSFVFANPITLFKSRVFTDDLGTTWVKDTQSPDLGENGYVANLPSTRVQLCHYTTLAAVVKPAIKKSVLGTPALALPVWASSSRVGTFGASLVHGLIGKIPTGSGSFNTRNYMLTSLGIAANGQLDPGTFAGGGVKHHPVDIACAVGEPAVKALPYPFIQNNQVSMAIAFKELINTETGFGDGANQIPNVDNVSAMTDDNGNQVLNGTMELTMPIGYVKNQI